MDVERGVVLGDGFGDAATVAASPAFVVAAAKDAAAVSIDSAPDDAALMLDYRGGDAHAFERLYSRHKGSLYRYLQRMCRNPETANDLFQEVWSKLIASRERYEARAKFTTFLFRIAHNCVVDHYRRNTRHQARREALDAVEEQLPAAEFEGPDARLAEHQLRTEFRHALDALPAEQRHVFVLYEESGLSLEEIGGITGVTMETAKSRLRYALTKLRATLKHHLTVSATP
jgi:RNA polymerase sigma-70 factor (ECF subfamily)